jgi:hypothetical protein
MTEHSPLPWALEGDEDGRVYVVDGDGIAIVEVYEDDLRWNQEAARKVVHRVNLHGELVAALEDMQSGWRYIRQRYGDLDGVGWERCERSATAVLARAKGEAS